MSDAPSKESLERIPLVMMYRSLERLSIAIEYCARIGFEESSPTRNESHAQIWLALNDAQADAKLKLKHYQKIVEQARERDEAAEKAKGQLDIIQRECEGEDEAFLANDYGGTGWEREAPVTTVREIRQAAEKLAGALEFGRRMVESTLAHVSHGGPSRQDAKEWVAMAQQSLTAWRERKGRR